MKHLPGGIPPKRRRWRSICIYLGFVILLVMVIGPTASFAETPRERQLREAYAEWQARQEAEQEAAQEPAPEPTSASPTSPAPDPSPGDGAAPAEATSDGTNAESAAAAGARQSSAQEVGTESHGGGPHKGGPGTVKIDGTPINVFPPGNEPHQGCSFVIQYYGFAAGVTANATLRAHPPTGSGQVVFQGSTVLQNDPAGGGTDFDGSIPVAVSQATLDQFEAHPQQGYHVKLSTTAGNVHKQKVFWLQPCPAAPGPEPGRIQIVKNALPDTSTPFGFEGDLGAFTLTDNGAGRRRTFSGLDAGTYVVREATAPTGWAFSSLACTDPTGNTSVSGPTATIRLAEGETVRCVFTNVVVLAREPVGPPLAVTGFSTVSWLIVGLSLIAAGTGSTILGRRRDEEDLAETAEDEPPVTRVMYETPRLGGFEDTAVMPPDRPSMLKPALIVGTTVIGVAAAWWLLKRRRG